MKRLLSGLMVLFLLCGLFVLSAQAEEAYLSQEAAVPLLRAYLENREEQFTLLVQTAETDLEKVCQELLEAAQAHTGLPTQGDYIRFHMERYDCSMHSQETEGVRNVEFSFSIRYYTTADQEAELTAQYDQVMSSLALEGKSDYEKAKAIYDYITANVSYDNTNLENESYTLKYSAYAALVNGTSVCQGYANLFYRMANDAGLDCRIIKGMGNGEAHGWNIVRIGNAYYYVDTTWDAGKTNYRYFLKGSSHFAGHVADEGYTGQEFLTAYPISEGDCLDPTQNHTHTPGAPVEKNRAEPTCTAQGGYDAVTYCTGCGAELERVPTILQALGHTPGAPEEENRVESTCTAGGSYDTVIRCIRCNIQLSRNPSQLPALGHSYSEGVCTVCQETDPDWHFHAPGEAVEENRVEPTCTAWGSYDTVTYCTVCSQEMSRETVQIPALAHVWDEGRITVEPTQEAEGEKTYTCTLCGRTVTETLSHLHTYTAEVTAPTCEEPGHTLHVCSCGHQYRDGYVMALGHDYEAGVCQTCGGEDPFYQIPDVNIRRYAGSDRFLTAFRIADAMKQTLGVEKFRTVVVASGTGFADALSGSYLAYTKNAPILLSHTSDSVNNSVKDYILSNLEEGGTVYILGGVNAVPASFETGLESFRVKRLAGENRFETNLLVLQEAGIYDEPLLVCSGSCFADSLSASAAGLPILLVGQELTQEQMAYLNLLHTETIYIIGGQKAVSLPLQTRISGYAPTYRLEGENRFETAKEIAETFFPGAARVVLASGSSFPDGLCGGPLAALMDAPLLLTMEGQEKQAAAYVCLNPIQSAAVLGGEASIPQTSINAIFG